MTETLKIINMKNTEYFPHSNARVSHTIHLLVWINPSSHFESLL